MYPRAEVITARAARILLIDHDLKLDMVRRKADSGSGPVPLGERNFLLLCEPMPHAGQTVSKERPLSSVWPCHFDSGANVVDVYVGRLRAKRGAEAIRTVRGKGCQIDGD